MPPCTSLHQPSLRDGQVGVWDQASSRARYLCRVGPGGCRVPRPGQSLFCYNMPHGKISGLFSCLRDFFNLRDSQKPHASLSSSKHDYAAVRAVLQMSRLRSLLCACFLLLESLHVAFTSPCMVPSPFVTYHY